MPFRFAIANTRLGKVKSKWAGFLFSPLVIPPPRKGSFPTLSDLSGGVEIDGKTNKNINLYKQLRTEMFQPILLFLQNCKFGLFPWCDI